MKFDKKIKYFNLTFYVLLLFLFILIVEGIFHHFYYKISQAFDFLPYKNQSGHNKYIWDENGIIEFLQVIILFVSLTFIIKHIINISSDLKFKLKSLLILYLIGVLYYFFEEISWGQHLIGWQTPEFFLKINTQNETNIHNASSLFNELPRNLLFIWCTLSFLIVNKLKIDSQYLNHFIFPNRNLKSISILILILFIPEFIVDKLDLAPGDRAKNDAEIRLAIFFDIVGFNFIRFSELQELLFNYYIFWHAYYLNQFKQLKGSYNLNEDKKQSKSY